MMSNYDISQHERVRINCVNFSHFFVLGKSNVYFQKECIFSGGIV